MRLVHVKELPTLTGYIRGGCSPVGMKKLFPTYIDASAINTDIISISAGQRGIQVLLEPKDIQAVTEAAFADLVMEDIILTEGRVRP